jgi:hypothetical protein
MLHFGWVAINFGEKVSFATFTTNVFPNISLALIFGIGTIMLAFYAILLLYIWPLKIETDPEKPLKWYYPVQCSYWSNSSDESDPSQNRVIDVRDSTDTEKLIGGIDSRASHST